MDPRIRRRRRALTVLTTAAAALAAVVLFAPAAGDPGPGPAPARGATLSGIHRIRHVIVIMQENRSFDSYFGTFPGADGIPMKNGRPAVCVPDPRTPRRCLRPYHDPHDRNSGGPHGPDAALADIAGGRMNGFVREALAGERKVCSSDRFLAMCTNGRSVDVLGYHDAREIPNYWRYARDFVLQDHMFEPNYGWSLPAHLFMVSAWSALCANSNEPLTCRPDLTKPEAPSTRALARRATRPAPSLYAWTDLTYLLHRDHVSWAYYVAPGSEPDCENADAMRCPFQLQGPRTPQIWNPLPRFTTVRRDGQLGNVQSVTNFFRAARKGTLPAVSWIVPNGRESEHPPSSVTRGQAWVTRLVDTVMRSPDWRSSAIFIAWDDWGGFYDHVRPPKVDAVGYGVRVPGLVVSPYARRGFVDHQVLSFDAYLKFIEDDFLHGARIDPRTDGRPDSRPDVRENAAVLGNLTRDFDFAQTPRPPVLLPPLPRRKA